MDSDLSDDIQVYCAEVIATPVNLALFTGTPQQPVDSEESPVLPDRSHYFDAGVTHGVLRNLEIGIGGYYKIADLLDDGQFGHAYVLSGFNFAHPYNEGVELKVKYQDANFKAYSNLARAVQKVTDSRRLLGEGWRPCTPLRLTLSV